MSIEFQVADRLMYSVMQIPVVPQERAYRSLTLSVSFNGLRIIYDVNEAQLIVLLQGKFEICSVLVFCKYMRRSRKWLNTDSIFLYVDKEAKAFSGNPGEF